ncbi:TRAP transporter permease [Geoalkalibacter halelectricus]|uniref:TRAP transporter fused permease subunit n=1 Tax=Geoalkalibacter halelectricus TaxID=2847045 RepID=A0ABY5ZNR0_9BACT|nr:TRAP transporter fused permease subunit [Geoalkalibacter halelectricus]MDO3377051.1 TRAP transporter fused permease subunit [Geoalkalibacter halelectricus]UWZ79495.1 TRAP transporter fused permease subunit [Geoalkalibacter halelectricus]
MSDALDKELADLDPEEKQKLKKLMEKDSKSFRSPTGLWNIIVAVLGAFMVLFYFYAAGVASVGTQYHLGVYVFITYILVFLLYPAGKAWVRAGLNLLLATILSSALAIVLFFKDHILYYERVMGLADAIKDEGLFAGLAHGASLWPLALAILALAAVLQIADLFCEKRWRNAPTPSDVLFALAAAGAVYYWLTQFEALNWRAGAENELDALISITGILISFEVCRRVLGWSMTLIGASMVAFAYFGPYLPNLLAHRGFSFERICNALFLTTNGVFGVMANVLATYVILFIFFGAFLHKSGAGRFFIDLPLAIAGRSTGGPAKVAVMASALFGSVSGSAIANTVSTGAFTIPLMKRAGFRPHVAGAIEPAASIGGMFLPPIMGAGGFLMAELTGLPYSYIMMISVGPALLYFFAVFCMIHFEAKKLNIVGIQGEEFPHWQAVLKDGWYYALPLVIITILMLMGRSPGNAAFWATLSCIAVSWVKKETRMGPREIWEAIQTGARNTLIIGATVGVIGVIVGIISLTGMGLKFSDLIIALAGNSLLLAIILIALASLVLGMGVPVTASYLIVAVLAVPALGEFGIAAIVAHQIVYWLSQDSNITPPVCVAAYAGAAVAGSDPWKTGWTAFKFAKMLYVMPLLFAFTPSILFQGKIVETKMPEIAAPFASVVQVNVRDGEDFLKGDVLVVVQAAGELKEIRAERDASAVVVPARPGGMISPGDTLVRGEIKPTPFRIFSSFFSAFLGTIAFSSLMMGYWIRRTSILEWAMLAPATFLLYWPSFITDGIGVAIVALVWIMQKTKNKREQATATA